MAYTGTVLVVRERGGYKRIHISELDRDRYERGRKVLWGKRRRYWKLKPEPVEMWRFSAGFSGGVQKGDYVSITYQEWSTDEGDYEGFKERARSYIDSELQGTWGSKYHREWDVWCGPPHYSDPQRVPYNEALVGELRPRTVSGTGAYKKSRAWRKAYASRMISAGNWFRQETLEKWSWIYDGPVE